MEVAICKELTKINEAVYRGYIKDMIDKINDLGAENIAAFIAEPIMGAGGIIVPPEGYHKKMREITQENEIMYIADEVVTAFGRLGHMFSSEDKYFFSLP